jgi:integrase
MVDNKPTLRIDETKTVGSRCVIVLDATTVTVLAAHRRRQLEERLAAGGVYTDRGLVFCNEIGEPVNPDRFTRTTKTLSKAAGVPPLSPHPAARHTWATLALEAGIPAKVVAERLGHASVSTTLDRYSHVIERMDRDAAETVAALFQGTAG